MAPSPVPHSIVCASTASVFESTVSVINTLDDVAAVSVADVPPTVTVQTGTFPVTQIAALAVIVIVSVPTSGVTDGVKMNLCLMGATPDESWLNDVAEPHTTEVAAVTVYVPLTAPVSAEETQLTPTTVLEAKLTSRLDEIAVEKMPAFATTTPVVIVATVPLPEMTTVP